MRSARSTSNKNWSDCVRISPMMFYVSDNTPRNSCHVYSVTEAVRRFLFFLQSPSPPQYHLLRFLILLEMSIYEPNVDYSVVGINPSFRFAKANEHTFS